MFHEVKVFDRQGNLKKIIPSEEIRKQFWNEFKTNSGRNSAQLRRKQNAEAKKLKEKSEE